MYDLIVLGGGPGGYEAAALAGAKGLSTCLVEKGALGGTCLNEGCIPLKYFLHISKTFKDMSGLVGAGVVNINNAEVLQQNVVTNKDFIIKSLCEGIGAKLSYNNVVIVNGYGVIESLTDDKVVVVVEEEKIIGKRLVIATGSSERRIEFEGRPTIPVIYSKEFLQLDFIPGNVVVVGAGVIGLEAASYFADLGTKVTLVDVMDRVGGSIDFEIEKIYERILKRSKIAMRLGTRVTAIRDNKVIVEGRDGCDEIETDVCLVAVGRVPNVENIGLEAVGIMFDKKGIYIDDRCITNKPNVYAVGDVTGKMMLAHAAYHQAQVAIDTIIGNDSRLRCDLIPSVIYSNPEITTVGLTEDICKNNDIQYIAKSIPMTYSGKYFAEHGRDGAIIKMIVDKDGMILGCSAIGNNSSELAIFFELLLEREYTVGDLKKLIFPHPTIGEIVKDLAEQFD